MNRPAEYLNWVTTQPTKRVAPPANLRLNGWGESVRPPFEYWNYQLWLLDSWIQYLDQSTNTGTPDQVIRLLSGGEWAFSKTSGIMSWSLAAHLSIAGIPDANNNIPAGSITIGEGQIAYVEANPPIIILGDIENGSAIISNINFVGNLQAGMAVSGAGIPLGTTLFSIGSTNATMSQNATADSTQEQLICSSTGDLSVVVINEQDFIPTLTTIMIAKRYQNVVYVGVNSSQMVLRDNEFKPFMGSGYFDTYDIVAGEALSHGDMIYISQGPTLDSGRVLGQAYKLDCSYPNHLERGTFAGSAISDCAASSTVTICYNGFVKFSGLSAGLTYWADPSNAGKITNIEPSSSGQKKIPVGFATSSTALVISNPAVGDTTLTQPIFKHEELGVGDNVNKIFNLSTIPLNTNSIFLLLDGGIVPQSKYSVLGQQITFVDAPDLAQDVSVIYALAGQTFVQGYQETPTLVSGSTYSLTGQPYSIDDLFVYVNGGVLKKSDFTLTVGSSTEITLNNALTVGQDLYVTYLSAVGQSSAPLLAINGIQNLGTGAGIFTNITSNVAKLRSIKSGLNISVDDSNPNEIIINAGGASGGMVAHGSKSAPIVISTGILTPSLDQRQVWYVVSDGGERPISLAAGSVVGQELKVKGCSATDFVSIDDTMGTDQNGKWNGRNNDSITYNWNGVDWDEDGRR